MTFSILETLNVETVVEICGVELSYPHPYIVVTDPCAARPATAELYYITTTLQFLLLHNGERNEKRGKRSNNPITDGKYATNNLVNDSHENKYFCSSSLKAGRTKHHKVNHKDFSK